MHLSSNDALAVVEAGFDLAATDSEWLASVTNAVSKLLRGPLGTVGYSFRRQSCLTYSFGPACVAGGDSSLAALTKEVLRHFSTDDIAACFRAKGIMSSMESCVMAMPRLSSTRGLPEFCGVVIGSETEGVTIGAPLPAPLTMRPAWRRQWRRISVHLASLMRLRTTLREPGPPRPAEAIFTPSGRALLLTGATRSSSARLALTTAVAQMERARGHIRHDRPQTVLDMWRELIAGRWTLVETVEHDGRRFIVAMPNAPEAAALRQLSERENVLLRLLVEGQNGADISARLGVSRSAVSQGIRSMLNKLRQPSVAALVAVASDLNLGRQPSALSLDGRGAWAVEAGAAASPGLQRLSPSEREVARYLLEGLSTAHIAELRGSAYRTVANQIASIYEKVAARSRADLGRKLRDHTEAR